MILETERLTLRPWSTDDAPALYRIASDPVIGLNAGWSPHKNVEESKRVIEDLLSSEETYAIMMEDSEELIGCASLLSENANVPLDADEAELGYWIGRDWWGQGFATEAAQELVRHAFEDLALNRLWCGYFDGNAGSMRVQSKCGFAFHHTNQHYLCLPLGEEKVLNISCLSRSDRN